MCDELETNMSNSPSHMLVNLGESHALEKVLVNRSSQKEPGWNKRGVMFVDIYFGDSKLPSLGLTSRAAYRGAKR